MAKQKEVTEEDSSPAIYVALGDRNEPGGYIHKGDVTDLAWLSDDAKGFVLFRGYYSPTSWEVVPDAVHASYLEHR
jgi:hypothetical protein